MPSGRITDILNGRRSIWVELQSQYVIVVVEGERGAEIARRVNPADAA